MRRVLPFRLLTVALASAAFATAVPAQAASPLIGTWAIEFEQGRRIENGNITSIMAKGTMTVVQQGDSLLATFDMPPRADGTQVPTMRITGRHGAEGAVFVQLQKLTLMINGETAVHDAKVTWLMKAAGDTLTGSIAREMPMAEPHEPGPIKGTRVKA